jgi:hypothetical protein
LLEPWQHCKAPEKPSGTLPGGQYEPPCGMYGLKLDLPRPL